MREDAKGRTGAGSKENCETNKGKQTMNQNERDSAVIVTTICLVAGALLFVLAVIGGLFK